MHYKNGRLAQAGDPVITVDYNKNVQVGILLDTVPASTCCNGTITRGGGLAPISVDTQQCYHAEDALNAVEGKLFAPPIQETPDTATGSAVKMPADSSSLPGSGAALNILVALLLLIGLSARAGFPIGSPSYLTVPTNSPIGSTATLSFTLPAVNVAVTQITNGMTQFTNNFCATLTNGPTVYTITASTIFNASGQGSIATPASTNFVIGAQTLTLPGYMFLQFSPQSGGTNTCSVQSF